MEIGFTYKGDFQIYSRVLLPDLPRSIITREAKCQMSTGSISVITNFIFYELVPRGIYFLIRGVVAGSADSRYRIETS